MLKFVLRKIFYGIVVLLGVITAIFFLFNVLPGDPATVMLGQRANKESVDAIHKELGTDKPLVTQYVHYLNDLSPVSVHNYINNQSLWFLNPEKYSWTPLFTIGDDKAVVFKIPYLRRSYITKRSVSEIILDTLPETAVLAFSAIIIASILGIALGILAAMKKNSVFDRVSFVLATVFGMSAPSYLVGLIMAWLFGYLLQEYTGLSAVGSLYDYDEWEGEVLNLKNLILPAITLGVRPLSIVIQLM
ncbi:MAG: ABC transporter permease, partial [Bacteroidia bacterium]